MSKLATMSVTTPSRTTAVADTAAALLRALERQHGHDGYSINVRDAMAALYESLKHELEVDPRDAAEG